MTPDEPSLESMLCDLQPAMLDDALISRLEAAAEGQLIELTHDELRFEEMLRGTAPAGLSPDFLAELEASFQNVPFPVNEKILLFPKGNVIPLETRKRPLWAAAAAVALVGAATALLLPISKSKVNLADQAPVSPPLVAHAAADNLVPAGFNRGVSNVSDEGMVWKNETQAHSLKRVEYVDKITLKDKTGRTFQVEQPRVCYLLVPEKTD